MTLILWIKVAAVLAAIGFVMVQHWARLRAATDRRMGAGRVAARPETMEDAS